MLPEFLIHHFRVHLEPKAPLQMPAFNKGNVIRDGVGSTFRLSADRQGGSCVMGIGRHVFVIVFVKERVHRGAGELRAAERVSVHARSRRVSEVRL